MARKPRRESADSDSSVRPIVRSPFRFPPRAFDGGYEWPLDFKYRIWQWNDLLEQIVTVIGPDLQEQGLAPPDSATRQTLDYARRLYECPGSEAVRWGRPISKKTRVRKGKVTEFPLVDSRKASPVWTYLATPVRLKEDDFVLLIEWTEPWAAHLTLDHRALLVETATPEEVHEELDHLKERLRRFRAMMSRYIPAGVQTFEIDRIRAPEPFRDARVLIHAHLFAAVSRLRVQKSERTLGQLVRAAWRDSVTEGRRGLESVRTHTSRQTSETTTHANWIAYLGGVKKPGWYDGKPMPKILDGLHPPCLTDGSEPEDDRRFVRDKRKWALKGPLTAEQLLLILAGFVYKGKITGPFGHWHGRTGTRARRGSAEDR